MRNHKTAVSRLNYEKQIESNFIKYIKRKTAFTLIELLVVTTIIILLAGIFFPVIQKAREKGRRTFCLNNLRQIGMAVNLYVQDNNGYMPAIDNLTRAILYTNLNTYLRNADIFWCPSSGSDRRWSGAAAPLTTSRISYGFNAGGTGVSGQTWPGPVNIHSGCFSDNYQAIANNYKLHSAIRAPSRMIMAADSYPDSHYEFNICYWPPVANVSWYPANRHNGGANVLFADGRAEWFAIKNLISSSSLIWQMWNADNQLVDYP